MLGELIIQSFKLIKAGANMKLITALILLAVFGVVGCTNGGMVLKKHDPQLTYRCDMDPYRPGECVNK